jgi:hypothetical protein
MTRTACEMTLTSKRRKRAVQERSRRDLSPGNASFTPADEETGASNVGFPYSERSRRKRHVIDYALSRRDESEANEIVQQATDFDEFVEACIDATFPNLRP